MVNVQFPSILKQITGEKRTTIKAESVNELIEKLIEYYGEDFKNALFEESGEMNRYIKLYLNGRVVDNIMKRDVRLNESSNVAILIVISGG